MSESYRIYGQRHLQKSINVDLDGVGQLLKHIGKDAAGANGSQFVDPSLVQELERDDVFQSKNR